MKYCLLYIRDLGVTLDSTLSFRDHISNRTRSCYYHLRRLKANRRSVSSSVFTSIVHAFICSRIDYCNSLFIGLPKVRLSPLQSVLNAAAIGLLPVSHDSPISPHSRLNTFIGFLLLPASSLRYSSSFADPTWDLPLNTSVMPYVGLPQPPLFAHSVLLIVSTFLFLV